MKQKSMSSWKAAFASIVVAAVALDVYSDPCGTQSTNLRVALCSGHDGALCDNDTFSKDVHCVGGGDSNYFCDSSGCGIVYMTITSGYCSGGVCDGSLGSSTIGPLIYNGTTCYPTKTTYTPCGW